MYPNSGAYTNGGTQGEGSMNGATVLLILVLIVGAVGVGMLIDQNRDLRAQLDQLQSENADLRGQNGALQQRTAALESENAELKSELANTCPQVPVTGAQPSITSQGGEKTSVVSLPPQQGSSAWQIGAVILVAMIGLGAVQLGRLSVKR